jgi:hypothetical protein
LQVFPSASGSSISQIVCPAGSYSRGTTCLPCEPGSYSRGKSNECVKCQAGSVSDAGASGCTPCPTGTTSFNNVCKSNCAFDVPVSEEINDRFDLRSLRGLIYTVVPNQNDQQPISYEINLCDPFISENCYEDKCNQPSYIYMYRNNDPTYYPTGLGSLFVFEDHRPPIDPTDDFSIDNYHSFDIVYTAKSTNNIPLGCNAVKSKIQFFCSSTAGRGDLVLEQFDQCNPIFLWNTTFACPKCQDFDLLEEYGACIENSRLVTQTWKRPCMDLDGILKESRTEPCQNIKVGRTTAIITVAAVLLVLLVGLALALLFFRQKRDIEVKYQLLKGENNLDDSDNEGLGEMRERSRKEDSVALESMGEGEDLPVGGDEDD